VKPPGADSAAREVAREFADAITAGDWAAAARLVTPRTNQGDLTFGLRRFMSDQSWTVTWTRFELPAKEGDRSCTQNLMD
jgi:hypothetical protein